MRWVVGLTAAAAFATSCASRPSAVQSPSATRTSAAPSSSSRRCLAWGGPSLGMAVSRAGKVMLAGEVTTDERPPFGMAVLLLREGRVVGRDVTHPWNPGSVASLERATVGRYGFTHVPSGEYEVVLKYGAAVVAREHVTVADEPYLEVRTHVNLSAHPRIPVCA